MSELRRIDCVIHGPTYTTASTCPSCAFTYRGLTKIMSPIETAPQSGGLKYDNGKPDFTFISVELMEAVARVRAFGAKKYARNNWKKGFKVTRSCAAALRHIFQFLSGETVDSESGESHLAHAICCLEHAIYDMKHHPDNDDRDKV